jgi:hypothetical protein
VSSSRLLHILPVIDRHQRLETSKGLLEVLLEVVSMLKMNEENQTLIPDGFYKQIQVH